jgi:DNA-binding MarR family transcriptional regulator
MSHSPSTGLRPQISAASPQTQLTTHLSPNTPPMRVLTPLVRRFLQICMAMIADSLSGAGLTPLQFAVLAYLNRQDGAPGIDRNGLASRLGVDPSHVSQLIVELNAKGLIDARVNRANRRARFLQLTGKGEKRFASLRADDVAVHDRILGPLAPHERELLLDMLIRMTEQNAAYDRPGAGQGKRGSRQSSSKENLTPPALATLR